MDDVNIHIDRLTVDLGKATDQDGLRAAIRRRMSGLLEGGYSHHVADAVAGAVQRAVSGADGGNSRYES